MSACKPASGLALGPSWAGPSAMIWLTGTGWGRVGGKWTKAGGCCGRDRAVVAGPSDPHCGRDVGCVLIGWRHGEPQPRVAPAAGHREWDCLAVHFADGARSRRWRRAVLPVDRVPQDLVQRRLWALVGLPER